MVAAPTNTILAIDLGNYKSAVCILDEASGEYRFTTFDTYRRDVSLQRLERLLSR
jgi:hypothetical protein